jgi:hypothetical protein
MAEKQKSGTVYQQLNRILNLDGFESSDQSPIIAPTPQQTKIIIKGNSPDEIKRKGLELEQKRELQKKFFRTTDRGFQKALQYEAARLPAYIDYEGFEFVPIISSALDLFMEESTTIGLNGKMLNIYSNKDRIKSLLEESFYDIVNVNVNLPFWVRNLCKYGDNFCLLYGERKKGITTVKQMVNYEIERFERIKDGKPIVKFKERMTGDEFNTFEIAHFRLLGDDKFLPYGCSVLNKIRRVTRQLIMAEDAMLTYRLVRAGEKKVFKIDVGNIDEDDIEDYIFKVATKFKKVGQVAPNDGQIDYRFNILGNDEDYFIPVRNANVQTGIDTLQGASNLSDIADIEYLRDNLFSGLGIPKPFLSFQDAGGGGKNLAQFDIRFSKKINRIQQAVIQELNKMAIIHLYLMGYEQDDLNSFTLSLTNPSLQQEQLKAELFREKAQTYAELTRSESGLAPMSHTNAKRLLFNMSDREIVEDLKQQKMEKVVMQEFADAPVIIKKSGLFTDIDKRFGEPVEGIPIPPENTETPESNVGGGMPEMPTSTQPSANATAQPPIPPQGGVEPTMGGQSTELSEEKIGGFDELINNMVFGGTSEPKQIKSNKRKKIINENTTKNNKLNTNAENMINEINDLLKTTESINSKNKIFENTLDINIDDIDM